MTEAEKIGIASDHAGYQMKEFLVGYLGAIGYDVIDYGTFTEESVDYPDFAHALANGLKDGEFERGISLCGTANGISMALNKHPHVRSAVCWIPEIARLAREHNDANICSLPARFIDNQLAAEMVDIFLATAFEGGRHQRRVEKIPCMD